RRHFRPHRPGAGILFNLKPNGDYLTVRANPPENNLVLWKFEKDERSSVKWIGDTPTPSRQWHDLRLGIAGTKVECYLDGKLYLEYERVGGRIGLWSKADSDMHLDDYTLTPAAMSPKDMQRAVLGPMRARGRVMIRRLAYLAILSSF